MRILIQRVKQASVLIDGKIHSQIEAGLLVFLGIAENDKDEDILWLTNKTINLRIFDDENGIMNLSVKELNKEILVVSQFTLHASTKKGNRPSYIRAATTVIAIPLYEKFLNQLEHDFGKKISTGVFGAMMLVELVNDGPVTIWMDSKNKE
ncbi:MAG: D-tyrosyl-tRNA(Tyr) deacylase [Chitinophagales bacterium]|nr:D-tyrosyl-tRNA(Tyr) deacylase [Chitinophagales bacterium]